MLSDDFDRARSGLFVVQVAPSRTPPSLSLHRRTTTYTPPGFATPAA